MKICANCHKPIGLTTESPPRYWDWRELCWRTFHHRNCKREYIHKRNEEANRRKAVASLYHPP